MSSKYKKENVTIMSRGTNPLKLYCLGVVVMPHSDEDSLVTRADVAQEIINLAKQMKEVN